MKFYRTGEAAKKLGVNRMTVLRWITKGKIQTIRVGCEYRISEAEVQRIIGGKPPRQEITAAIHARVSSADQKNDLPRQVAHLQEYCAARGYQVRETLTDIAPGLNEQRRGLKKLFHLVTFWLPLPNHAFCGTWRQNRHHLR